MPSDRFDYYLEQCRIHHAVSKTFSGNGCLKHARALVAMSKAIGATSAIDYGCGKGNQYAASFMLDGQEAMIEQALGYEVTKYDPAVPKFEKPPERPADLVWCTDVLEHIPEEDISFIVGELSRLALKGVFVTIGTYPAKKVLPNGENAHVCIKPVEWWEEQFLPLFNRAADTLMTDAPFTFQMLCE